MTRTGKIARLPDEIRQQINHRLQNGEESKTIVKWLNSLHDVQIMIVQEFDDQPISESNLSQWKNGGYRDWLDQQEALEAFGRFNTDATALQQTAAGQPTDQMALFLTARVAVAMRHLNASETDAASQIQGLRHLCRALEVLRRGDHDSAWLRLERERLDLQQKKFEADAAVQKAKDQKFTSPTAETLAQIAEKFHLL